MVKAVVLLTLEPNVGRAPIEAVKGITGVVESYMLYGPFDGFALVEAPDSK